MRPLVVPLSQPRFCSSRTPAPSQSGPVASWRLLPSPQPQAAKVGSLTATLHNSAPLRLGLFLPDTQLLLCIWITFLCYGILVVFPIPPSSPLPLPVAGFLRRGVLRESHKHICSLAAALQEGPIRGSGPRELGHAGQRRLEGRVQGPWQLRPGVGTLTAAGRAASGPVGAAKVLEPQLANSLALLVVAAGSRLRSVYARLRVRGKRGAFRNTLASRLLFCQQS